MQRLPKIYGFNKTSEAGKDVFAYSIFLGGCNLRCPYCMNARLVKCEISKEVSLEEIKKEVLMSETEMVMISGGEPTLSGTESLICLLKEIQSWGCRTGLSTNGLMPFVLANVLPTLNYVALDLKTPDDNVYTKISSSERACIEIGCLSLVKSSITAIHSEKQGRKDFDYEIRTTLFPPFVSANNIMNIAMIIPTDATWILQKFRHSKNMLEPECVNVNPYDDREIEEIVALAKRFCPNVSLRYV